MGQIVPFPHLHVPNTPRVASALAGDIPLWRADAEVFGPTGPRHVSAILVQPAPGRLDLLRAMVQGQPVEALPRDPGVPDPSWGDVAYALLGLWLEAPPIPPDLRLVQIAGEIAGLQVEAALTVGFASVRGVVWTAQEPGRDGVVVHGRITALAP